MPLKYISRKIVFSAFLFFCCFYSATAQPTGYKEKYIEGCYLMLEENYDDALKNFLTAFYIDSSNANINYNIGVCYLKIDSKKHNALPFLKKAVADVTDVYKTFNASEKKAPVNAFYYLGMAYHLNYQFEEAVDSYEKFKSFLQPKQFGLLDDTDRLIYMSANARQYMAMPNKVTIANMGDSINTQYPDYGQVISADETMMVFTSRRPGATGGMNEDGEYNEDIYISYRKPGTTIWTAAVSIGTNINTPAHEASIGLSADGQQLFIYKDDKGDGNIYVSTLEGDTWSVPQKMGGEINTTAWEPSACLSSDGSTIYFSSNRKGGMGGRDLYRCVKLPNGAWSKALNLGPTVNTEYDEDAPFIHPDGNSLIFSSNGHKSMGGFDIFFSNKTEYGWTIPTNMRYPINTTDDDIFYVMSTDGKRAYYSTLLSDGKGEKDIYMATLEEATDVAPVALIIGKIIPEAGKEIPDDLEIQVTDVNTNATGIYKPNIRSGKYVLSLDPGHSYSISYVMGDKELFNETMNVSASSNYYEMQQEISLDPVKINMQTVVQEAAKDSVVIQPVANNVLKSENEKKPPANEMTENKAAAPAADETLVYKVAISTVKKQPNDEVFKTVKDLTYDVMPDGRYKYFSGGIFKDYEAAKSYRDKMKKNGFKDAYLVPMRSGTTGNAVAAVNAKEEKLLAEQKANEKPKAEKKENPKTEKTETIVSGLTQSTADVFEMYFKYNVTEIPSGDYDFAAFINNIINAVNTRGKIKIQIFSSASQVPTRAFKTNRELAEKRGETTKTLLQKMLTEKNMDASKVAVEVKATVNGPEYNDDYLINKVKYEQFQYIKITIR